MTTLTRPGASSSTVWIAPASTEAWRVRGLVTAGNNVRAACERAERGRRARTARGPRPHRLLEPAPLAAAAAGRARDGRLDPLLPGARDDDGGDLRGHRRQRPRRDERPARGGRDVRRMEADLGRRGRPRRALRLSV